VGQPDVPNSEPMTRCMNRRFFRRIPLYGKRRFVAAMTAASFVMLYAFELQVMTPQPARVQSEGHTWCLGTRWREKQILQYMGENPSRAYFADLFRKGCFRSGIEMGVADGRFSEHFLRLGSQVPLVWYMIEPFPNPELKKRFWISSDGTADFLNGTWSRQGIGRNAHTIFVQEFSTDSRLIRDIADNSIDFIYLDGAHDHDNVYKELSMYFRKVKPGGVLAGHDYCNRGESPLDCEGCSFIPKCAKYTEYGIAHGKPQGKLAVNQNAVVRAVQEWIVQEQPGLAVHFTREDFTRDSLSVTKMDYDLIVTNTRNPSWYFVKP